MIEVIVVAVVFALGCLDWSNLFAKPRREWPCDFTARKESCCPTLKCEPVSDAAKARDLPIAWRNYYRRIGLKTDATGPLAVR